MWFDKRYYSLNYFYRTRYNQKVAKISLNAGLTCPNRDGTLSYDGCIFCSNGSGYFDELQGKSITEQFYIYKKRIDNKWGELKYIAYFQAFTNTYGDVKYLKKIYEEATKIKNVVGISIATRPDCLSDDILEVLYNLNKTTDVYIELGLQTANPKTASIINRCYDNDVYINSVKKLNQIGVNIVTHLIIGLPFETKEDILDTIRFISSHPLDGVKLQLLHVLKNTKLLDMYNNKEFDVLSLDEYTDIIVCCLELLPPNIVIHRINGDSPSEILVAPEYCLNKRNTLNAVDKKLRSLDTWQGKNLER